MSASSKKKLRKEQEALQMTEKQLQEKKEAKKLKIYSIVFVVVMVLAIGFFLVRTAANVWNNNGMSDRLTTAVKVNDEKIKVAELNYYYMDTISQYYNNYYQYFGNSTPALLKDVGLDVTKPLDQQFMDAEKKVTWGEYFANLAVQNATEVVVLLEEAEKAGYTLTEEEIAAIDAELSQTEAYILSTSTITGYTSLEDYLKASYGKGSTVKSYRKYLEDKALAASFYNQYPTKLSYTDADYEAFDKAHANEYSNYSYYTFRMNVEDFYGEGTKGEDGKVTYTDEQKAEGEKLAAEAVKLVENFGPIDKTQLNGVIQRIDAYKGDKKAVATDNLNKTYTNISSEDIRNWVSAAERKPGDNTVIAIKSTTKDADGKDVETITGYFVVVFSKREDNNFGLANVRHILIEPAKSGKDADGEAVATEAEKLEAKKKAEAVLAQFNATSKTEADFAALVKDNSTDSGSKDNGGLYEDILPGYMVSEFNDWCFAKGRKAGDCEIVETSLGYHIIYFVGHSDTTYREYLVDRDLRAEDQQEWIKGLVAKANVAKKDISDLNLGYVISPAA